MRISILGILSLVGGVSLASTARAQDSACSTFQSEVTLGALSGERIDSVLVKTAKPSMGRVGDLVGRLHVTTQQGVIRRELLFAPSDTVDTLQITESLRRLRSLSFLEYAEIQARRCISNTGHSLALTVVTRDAWTARPEVKAGSTRPRVGLTEANVFGSGRTASIDVVARNRTIGVGLTTNDSFGFGTGVSTRGQYQRFPDGSLEGLLLSRRQATVADRWRASLNVFDQRYEPRGPRSDNFERTSADFIAGVRVTRRNSAHAVYLLGGFELERASLGFGVCATRRRGPAPEQAHPTAKQNPTTTTTNRPAHRISISEVSWVQYLRGRQSSVSQESALPISADSCGFSMARTI